MANVGPMRLSPMRVLAALAVVVAAALMVALPAAAQERQPYKDSAQPVAARVQDLLGRMTLQEKFWQLYMTPGDRASAADDWSRGVFGLQVRGTGLRAGAPRAEVARAHAARVQSIQRYFTDSTRLGIPMIPFEEAVHGSMSDASTVFPAAIGLAASWDTALVGRVFAATALEVRSRGVRQVLSPVINIANDVRWGRVEETYGEDPYLSSVVGAKYVNVLERHDIVTTPKHFVANVGEGGRDSYPIDISPRALAEIHFPPFVATVKGGARSVMTAYNSVDGVPATQNRRLLTDVLRKEWGFEGVVISDAAATGGATVLHFTEPNTPTAAKHAWEAGLDVVFQTTWAQHRPYLQAVEQRLVAPEVIDSAVARVLRLKFSLGLFENADSDPAAAAQLAGSVEHLAIARDAAERAMVLLRNERGTLPLGPAVKRVALIGEDAREPRLGGYTGDGAEPVSVLTALRARLGAANVSYAVGAERISREYAVVPESALSTDSAGVPLFGLRGDYWADPDFTGEPRLTRRDAGVNFGWTLSSPGRGIPYDWYSARWTGKIRVPRGGIRRLGVEGNDGWRLWVDGKLLIDNWQKQSYRARLALVALAPGSRHDIKLEFHERVGNARVKLVWDAGPRDDWRAKIAAAVTAARGADVAVVVAGIEEGEFRDRSTLALPGHQEELIEAVAATGKPTVAVVIGGSAITGGRWLDRVGALLYAWYPGERGGEAIVRTLFGDANPAGRLPITFPLRDGQLPLTYNHKPTGRGDDYTDGTGMALFPFGHGLSYTRFEYTGLRITPDTVRASAVPTITVRARIKNAGIRAGDEVVQLYLRDVLASVARPVIQLAGFTRIALAPGEEKEVTFTLDSDQLSLLDVNLKRVVEPGQFRLMVGASSKDIRLRGFLTVR